jgi:pimeloyl-ACP methyl ester carboxylesterase
MTTIACIPGLLCTRAVFDAFVAALPQGAEALTLDLPDSDDFDAIARQIAAQISDDTVLVGMSMGSYLALAVQRLRPQAVAGLVLIGTNARADTPEAAANRQKAVKYAHKAGMRALADSLADLMLGTAQRADPALRNQITDMAEATGAQVFARHQHALATRPDQRAALPTIACPVLVITGREDTITPPATGEELALAVPQGKQVILPGAGHLPLLEAPGQVAGLVARFLTDLPGNEGLQA